jgi:hypothetical protein
MELKKVIQLLKDLPADAGLDSEENWKDSPDTQLWRLDAIKALKYAVNILEEGKVVGTLELEGKTYKITK